MSRLSCDARFPVTRERCTNEGIMYLVDTVQRPICRVHAAVFYKRGASIFLAQPVALTDERLIDGFERVRARLFAPPVGELPACAEGTHCAAHGDGPHVCCRCGAEFVEAALDVSDEER